MMILTKLKGYLIAAGLALVGFLALVAKIQSDTKEKINAKRNKKRLEVVREAKEIEDEVNSNEPDDNRKRLFDKFGKGGM